MFLVLVLSAAMSWPWAAGAAPLPESERLKVKGFRAAVMVPPEGEGKRPVVVGLHGNFDRPEWLCSALRSMVAGKAWILCPRGVPRADVPRAMDRWTYRGRAQVMREIKAGLTALRDRYPERVAGEPHVLAGFSLGAILSARFAVARPARFPRLYLAEGSYRVWTPKNVRRFARGGGQEVVFGCGRRGCRARTRRICKRLEKRGVTCHVYMASGLGHSYSEPLPRLAGPRVRHMLTADPRTGE
jgi:predicted esterase